ncbi:MAG: NTP transferase domain-containing protein [Candidatus Aenigmarchaeota archaeon]|nr:NTP transferase domain-containing protein [Candidatus Aenigmarchaeota archaeon]
MTKIRLSISIDRSVAARIDALVDGVTTKSRSEAIERVLREQLKDRKTAVILAGGEPSSLLVRGLNVYRPLVNIGERTLVEDQVLKARAAGFHNFVVVGHPNVISKIYEVIGNGKRHDVSVVYVEENDPKGNAKTLEKIKEHVRTDFLLIPCDHYFDFDLKNIYEFHVKNQGAATFGVHNLTSFEYAKTSVLVMEGMHIIDYEERPTKPKTHLVSTFIGYLKPEIFDYIAPGNVRWVLQEHVFPRLAKERKLFGYPVSGNWVNVHTREDVELVRTLAKQR